MQSVLAPALDCVVGALETDVEATGVTFHRTRHSARVRFADPAFDFVSATPSGVRIEMLTTAAQVELDVVLTTLVPPGLPVADTLFDLVVDGVLRAPAGTSVQTVVRVDPDTGAVAVEPAGVATLRFDIGGDAGAAERRVEIWFAAAAHVRLLDVRISTGASLRPAPPSGPLWVHHGSSISQCSEADRPTATWPAIVARRDGMSLLNLGLGGQCHLDPCMARTIRDLPAATISLCIGINIVNGDTMRERAFVAAFHGFIDTIRDKHPTTPITIITPIFCHAVEHHPGPTVPASVSQVGTVERAPALAAGALSLGRIRELLHHHVDIRRTEGDGALTIVDGLTLFGPGDSADLPDGLHPNTAGYRRMAERMRIPVPAEAAR
ncbi:SGNH/GDSL hydrolase family protein [Yinghuangia soli]|uniref:GDSL-type esterase/lipase family protein n=1 Tax=Yinghuangia soli TaxID=2908204 RepID=A0AA41Q6K9_9ACTN|nr:SGNH/GDSL hydrolase family protein [Yinghuangia soli]MCF2531132.1 GDSL-type esterase/lipase family protein [Yinghuangia soli]